MRLRAAAFVVVDRQRGHLAPGGDRVSGHACFGSGNQGQGSLDAGRDPVATATTDAIAARVVGEAPQPHIAWLSARSEYWPPRGGGEASWGVAGLLFGVGAGGVGWLARLARSGWFAGLELRAEDLAAGGVPSGGWVTPADGASGDGDHLAAAAEAFVASAPLPSAWYAAVAVPRGAGPGELSAALELTGALRERRDPLGRRLTVVTTVEASSSLDGAFVRRLLDSGAFVVRAGRGAAGDHLHHFPLRAPMCPRRGRWVCVGLADYLQTWRPGRVADLHATPTGFADAARSLRRVPVPDGGARALNLVFYLDRDAPGSPIREMDRLADHCRDLFLRPDGDMVFTDADRLDGRTGSADLLVVHAAAADG